MIQKHGICCKPTTPTRSRFGTELHDSMTAYKYAWEYIINASLRGDCSFGFSHFWDSFTRLSAKSLNWTNHTPREVVRCPLSMRARKVLEDSTKKMDFFFKRSCVGTKKYTDFTFRRIISIFTGTQDPWVNRELIFVQLPLGAHLKFENGVYRLDGEDAG